jgi:hypothetical protein
MFGLFQITLLFCFHLPMNVTPDTSLKNGTYRIIQFTPSAKYKDKITTESYLSIRDEHFVRYWNDGDTLKGKIEWIGERSFKLISLNQEKTEPTELGKLINRSFGESLFELKGKGKRKIQFRTTYTGNLHITTSEGIIKRMR